MEQEYETEWEKNKHPKWVSILCILKNYFPLSPSNFSLISFLI